MSQTIMLMSFDRAPGQSRAAKAMCDALVNSGKNVGFFKATNVTSNGLSEKEAFEIWSTRGAAAVEDAMMVAYEAMASRYDIVVAESTCGSLFLEGLGLRLDIALAHNTNATILWVCDSKDSSEVSDVAKRARDLMRMYGLEIKGILSSVKPETREEDLGYYSIEEPPTSLLLEGSSMYMSPYRFLSKLRVRASASQQTIVLPEGTEARILRAVKEIRRKKIAKIVLIGEKDAIRRKADELGIVLDEGVKTVNPAEDPRLEEYAKTLYELRKAKGLTEEKASELMRDKTYFGTMMVYKGDADGLVSGATTTTAETLRPALQFIKTKPGIRTISGAFLMCLRERVLLFADCAVIPNATAEQLSDTAAAAAETARNFGITPKVALLSYSTGDSGSGPDVDLVKEATRIAKENHPHLELEGPLQFDAAIDPEVAATKLPGNPVAGKANVFIFPSLSAGNIGYKTAQRTGNAIAIGPILQGIRKPVNDLSRGATVVDIVNTVLITAIQALDEQV